MFIHVSIKKWHKYSGIPNYLYGHGTRKIKGELKPNWKGGVETFRERNRKSSLDYYYRNKNEVQEKRKKRENKLSEKKCVDCGIKLKISSYYANVKRCRKCADKKLRLLNMDYTSEELNKVRCRLFNIGINMKNLDKKFIKANLLLIRANERIKECQKQT